MSTESTKLFPAFINLKNKDVLIIGAGNVALEKLNSLFYTGANLTIIAGHISVEVKNIAESNPSIILIERNAEFSDLNNRDLIFLATNQSDTNSKFYEYAKSLKIWVNSVDDPKHCDFFSAAVFDRGAFRIAISTDGKFAGLSSSVRKVLDLIVPEEHQDELIYFTELRNRLKEKLKSPKDRIEVMRKLLKDFETQYFELETIKELKNERTRQG